MKKTYSKALTAVLIATVTSNIYTVNNVYADTFNSINEESSIEDQKWNLVWEDNFDGDSLDLNNWNYETHEPGWVNNELQEYTDSLDNIYVKDGNLILKGIKEETEEGIKYTSGKVTTQNKRDYKYGRFEAKLKVPEGQGLWPAFWMMPTDENLYGSWPRCGEIDIMEILGHEPNKAYGTIHYGNPHKESQGYYVLDGESFADDYHIFAVEWEPSEMRFYIDGNLYHTVNDWFTKQDGGDEITYPAPFDQTFYLQFNLAIGGNWPGNPDETTNFDNAEYKIDYVKVYQLDNYDENVSKPEKLPVDLRDPDETGNYINNGDFSKAEDLTDNVDWALLTTLGGKGSSEIKDNKIILSSESQGKEDYSLQLLQAGLPLEKNGIYKISFDAKAAEPRNMIVNMTSPNRGYIRQFQDTLVDLTSEFKTYTYEFTMKDDDDANGRLEFNYGNRGSLADIEITNVRLEKIGQKENINEEIKTILPDGNYVYNGTFDVGQDRMKYWEVDSKIDGVKSLVTNKNNIREFKVNVPSTVSSLADVILRESELGIATNKEYYLSFDAYGEEDKTIKAQINAESFEANVTKEKKNFKYKFKTDDILKNTNLEFLLGTPGVTYIDNVKIIDTSLIVNGDFSNEFSKWEVFSDSSVSSNVTSSIDKSAGNNAALINIGSTGDADWKIQLKQSGIKLEQGKKYKLSLDAKSTIDRPIMFTIQRDGSNDDDWRPYVTTQIVDLKNEYNTYDVTFEMTENSDLNSIFSISMGAVNDTQISDKHSIYIDNVNLVEVNDVELNVENLLDYILQAKKIINDDSFNDIVDSDRENLINSLNKAEKVYDDAISQTPSVTQDNIDEAATALKNSIDNLTKKGEEDNKGEENDPPKGDVNGGSSNNNGGTNNDGEANSGNPNIDNPTGNGSSNGSGSGNQTSSGNSNNQKPNNTKPNNNSSLVHTGQRTYLFIAGSLLVLSGAILNFFNLKRKMKKNK